MKNQKGITLVALIITVIVMLILAGTTIYFLFNQSIFEKTNTAVTEYNAKVENLEQQVNILNTELDRYYDLYYNTQS